MSITEFLNTPDCALLVSIDGDIELIIKQHETPTRAIVERFPLGPVANVDAVMALVSMIHTQGTCPSTAPLPPTQQPALPAPGNAIVCAVCDKTFKSPSGLATHRRLAHTDEPVAQQHVCSCGRAYHYPSDLARHQKTCRGRIYKAQEPVACDLCDRTFTTRVGLATHKARVHTGSTRSTRKKTEASPEPAAQAPATPAPAEAAPVTPESTDAPQAVLVDLPLVTAPPIAFEDPRLRKAAPVASGICETCHEPLISHDECDVCTTLIGPGHATEQPVFVSGLDLCHDCAREQVMRRRAELRKEAAA